MLTSRGRYKSSQEVTRVLLTPVQERTGLWSCSEGHTMLARAGSPLEMGPAFCTLCLQPRAVCLLDPRGQQEPSARLSSFKAALGFLPATLRKAPHSFWHISTLLLLFLSPSLPSHADAALTNIARLLYQGIDQKSLPTRKPSLLASTRLPALGPACQA